MHVTRFAIAFVTLVALTLLASSAARANIEYPWCAVYGGRGGGATNCGFSTIEQCRATVSGIGGSCEPNQFYRPPSRKPPRRTHQPDQQQQPAYPSGWSWPSYFHDN